MSGFFFCESLLLKHLVLTILCLFKKIGTPDSCWYIWKLNLNLIMGKLLYFSSLTTAYLILKFTHCFWSRCSYLRLYIFGYIFSAIYFRLYIFRFLFSAIYFRLYIFGYIFLALYFRLYIFGYIFSALYFWLYIFGYIISAIHFRLYIFNI